MADTVYLIPGAGLYKDTEQDTIVLIPGGGLYKERTPETGGSTLLPIKINAGLVNNSLTVPRLIA